MRLALAGSGLGAVIMTQWQPRRNSATRGLFLAQQCGSLLWRQEGGLDSVPPQLVQLSLVEAELLLCYPVFMAEVDAADGRVVAVEGGEKAARQE